MSYSTTATACNSGEKMAIRQILEVFGPPTAVPAKFETLLPNPTPYPGYVIRWHCCSQQVNSDANRTPATSNKQLKGVVSKDFNLQGEPAK